MVILAVVGAKRELWACCSVIEKGGSGNGAFVVGLVALLRCRGAKVMMRISQCDSSMPFCGAALSLSHMRRRDVRRA